MVAGPNQPVSALPLLDAAERRRLLVEWNQTDAEYPHDKCIHQLFEEQAARTPESIAAVFEDRAAHLRRAGRRLEPARASSAKSLGVGPETTVGICLDRSLDMLVGSARSTEGRRSVRASRPLYPRERIAAVIEDSTPAVDPDARGHRVATRAGIPCRMVSLDQARAAILRESSRKPGNAGLAAKPGVLIFTSGSTGQTQGRRDYASSPSSTCCRRWRASRASVAQDTLLAVTTLSFDIAVLELFLPLVVGARVVIAGREDVIDGNRLLALVAASGATVIQATPATWRLLLEAGWNGRPQIKVLCGGEALPRDLADAPAGAILFGLEHVWSDRDHRLVGNVARRARSGADHDRAADREHAVLRGRWLGSARARSVYPANCSSAATESHAATGSSQHFRPRSSSGILFDDDRGSLLYKTGDLVRYLPNGRLEFLGRLDSQVKVRGFRIEASEVESVIMQFPGVRECVVVAREDAPGDKRLVAYLVAEGLAPAPAELRRFIAAKLPEYMVPTNFVPLDALPRTPNRQGGSAETPGPRDWLMAASAQEHVAASSPRERALADICANVLHVDRVSVDGQLV